MPAVGPSAQIKASPPTPTLHALVSIISLTMTLWPECKQEFFWRKGLILYILAFVKAGNLTLKKVIQVGVSSLKTTSALFCIFLSFILMAGLFKKRKQKQSKARK